MIETRFEGFDAAADATLLQRVKAASRELEQEFGEPDLMTLQITWTRHDTAKRPEIELTLNHIGFVESFAFTVAEIEDENTHGERLHQLTRDFVAESMRWTVHEMQRLTREWRDVAAVEN